jgi:alkylation response protein AidB-like acyl-CoA dehydrogenase
MPIELSEDLKMLRQTIREFTEKVVAPVSRQYDEEEAVPYPVLKKAAEMGLMGIPFPEEYGGIEMGITAYCILMEELNRFDASIGTIIGASVQLAGMTIFLAGTEEQKRKYLTPIATGEKIGAWCLTEPNAGSDAAHIRTTAQQRGDEWVLNGSKMWITNGSFADTLVVFATVDPSLGPRGITAFIVEKDFPGFKVGKVEEKMGLRASHTASVFFEDCRVPAANVIGQPGQTCRTRRGITWLGETSLRVRARLCRGAPAVWAAHRRFPGDSVQAGRDGGQDLHDGADRL